MYIVNQEKNRCEKCEKVFYTNGVIYINGLEFDSYRQNSSQGRKVFELLIEELSRDSKLYEIPEEEI